MSPLEESWLALHLVEGLGAKTLTRLLEHFEAVSALLSADPAEIARAGKIRPDLAERIAAAPRSKALAVEMQRVSQHGARVVPMPSVEYPRRLREINFPPLLFYCRGTMPDPAAPVLAVVGTRNFTRYGERITRELISGLAGRNPAPVIVSGLARGIDTVAHEQALESGLPTLAVLGGGLGRVYPRENTELAERVTGGGALLSEFPMDGRPLAKNFPVRNRVISGLADAVLVVEAAEKSGALITAGFAMNYQRPLLAVPGNLGQEASAGPNRLIHDGQASLVRGVGDLIEALGGRAHPGGMGEGAPPPPAQRQVREQGQVQGTSSVLTALEGEKRRIAELLKKGPLHPDDLSGELGLPIEKLIGLLLELELSGDIYQSSDNRYALS